MPQERQFTQKEVDALIQKALTFQTEPPERQKERVQKYLPVYLVCSVLGIVEALAVWGFGLAETEMARMSLILGVGFGVVYGAYAFFWMTETLPRYYDENRIAQFAQGAMHIHIPGVYYNNRNWPYVLRVFRVWSDGVHAVAAALPRGGGDAGTTYRRECGCGGVCRLYSQPVCGTGLACQEVRKRQKYIKAQGSRTAPFCAAPLCATIEPKQTKQENEHAQRFTDRPVRTGGFYPHAATPWPGRGVFLCLQWLRELLPWAGGYRPLRV